MKIKKEELPVTMESPGIKMRGLSGLGGMTLESQYYQGFGLFVPGTL